MKACARPFSTMRPSLCALPGATSLCASVAGRRFYAVQAPGAPRFQVFNRRTKWLQKERIAANPELSRQADYLKDEVAMRLSERLLVSIVPGSPLAVTSRL